MSKKELRIVIRLDEVLPGFPFTAILEGASPKSCGYGVTIEAAVHDLFTTARASEIAKAFEATA